MCKSTFLLLKKGRTFDLHIYISWNETILYFASECLSQELTNKLWQRAFLWIWSSYASDKRSQLHWVNTVGCTEPSSFHSANAQLLKDRESERLPPNSKPTEHVITKHQPFQPNRSGTSKPIPTNSTCWSTPPRRAVTLEAWRNFVTNSTISTGIRYTSMLSWGERRKEILPKYSSSTS